MSRANFPIGVATFLGAQAARGVAIPRDFADWLADAPMALDPDQCSALLVAARAWTPALQVSASQEPK